MSLRKMARRLVIRGSTTLRLDTVERLRERRELRRRRTAVVRVLYLHGTPPAHAAAFRRHLHWLQRHFRVIDMATFGQMLARTAPPDGDRPAVLLTFDDGVQSNYDVAAPILEAAGLRALFFVVPAFSALGGERSRRFYRERMRKPDGTDTAMTPDQIRDLAARGHTIGNHTLSHAHLGVTPASEYAREILESAAIIESWTGRSVNAFAWPFVWNAITPEAHAMAASRHRYCFAPCAGRVEPGNLPGLLWRTSIEAGATLPELRFQCSPLADRAAASRRRQLMATLTNGFRRREAA